MSPPPSAPEPAPAPAPAPESSVAPPLPPLLGNAFPTPAFSDAERQALSRLQAVIDRDLAPAAAANDRGGRYPTASIAALKRSGILRAGLPPDTGGAGFPLRFSVEAQLRIAIADAGVAQLFKVHDELTRELFVYAPEALKPWLRRRSHKK